MTFVLHLLQRYTTNMHIYCFRMRSQVVRVDESICVLVLAIRTCNSSRVELLLDFGTVATIESRWYRHLGTYYRSFLDATIIVKPLYSLALS